MTQKGKYLVAWMSRTDPLKRGFLEGIHTLEDAEAVVEVRNTTVEFGQDVHWAVKIPPKRQARATSMARTMKF